MGVDMGTSGCRAVVFDEKWNIACTAYREYPFFFPGNGLIELDAEVVWQRLTEVIAEANSKAKTPVGALAISAIGDVIIPVDRYGTPIRHSIVDFDCRGQAEIACFANAFGRQRFFETTGMPPIYIGSLAKILWIKKNEPSLFENTVRFATYEDYIIGRLGMEPAVSLSEAARTMLLDIRKKDWADEILEKVPIGKQQLAKPVPSGTRLGALGESMCRKLHFAGKVELVSGGHDMVCAAVGAGLNEDTPELAVDIAGTIEGIVASMKEPNTSKKMLDNLLPCYPAYKSYITFSVNLTAGCVMRWYRDKLAEEENRYCRKNGLNIFEYMQSKVDTLVPGKLIVLPHFSGSGNPGFDPLAQGAMYGMNLDTDKPDIARAIVEGLCYELKTHLDAYRKAGMDIRSIRAVGGGASIDRQLALKANILQIPVRKGVVRESSAMGAAAYAAAAMGELNNPFQAFLSIAAEEKVFEPDTRAAALFEQAYLQYAQFADAVRSFERIR